LAEGKVLPLNTLTQPPARRVVNVRPKLPQWFPEEALEDPYRTHLRL
jgi:hypothetical protein